MYSLTALLPRFSVKRRAWNVGVLSPAVNVVPGISLRPLSPIRHTYTSAVGFSDSATSGCGAVRGAGATPAACRRGWVIFDLAALEVPVPLLEPPPPAT